MNQPFHLSLFSFSLFPFITVLSRFRLVTGKTVWNKGFEALPCLPYALANDHKSHNAIASSPKIPLTA